MYLILLAFLVASLSNLSDCRSPKYSVVNTADGTVRGKLDTTLFDKKEYYAFKGIPFAQPPVGNLRFMVCILF